MSSSTRPYDLVLFGATSFTGYFCIRELVLSIADHNNNSLKSPLKWAIAGRNREKMIQVLERLSFELTINLIHISMLEADIKDVKSLEAMTCSTTLLLNTVGPYRLYGRPVIKACLATSTHYIDISAEIQFNEQMQIDFHKTAELKNILIINCCGWSSVPVDMAVALMKEQFKPGVLSTVEVFADVKPGPAGYRLHSGTFSSMVHVYAKYGKLRGIRRQLFSGDILPAEVPYVGAKISRHKILLPPFSHHIYIQFPSPDGSVVKRTQFYNYQHYSEEVPIQIQTYIRVRFLFNQILGFPLMTSLFWWKRGRQLLEKNVGFWTGGFVSEDGPSREQIDGARCSFKLIGRGFEKMAGNNDKPDKKMILNITAPEPGYLATAIFAMQCALTALEDREKMPRGGVLTTASAFQWTGLIDRLEARGVDFTWKKS